MVYRNVASRSIVDVLLIFWCWIYLRWRRTNDALSLNDCCYVFLLYTCCTSFILYLVGRWYIFCCFCCCFCCPVPVHRYVLVRWWWWLVDSWMNGMDGLIWYISSVGMPDFHLIARSWNLLSARRVVERVAGSVMLGWWWRIVGWMDIASPFPRRTWSFCWLLVGLFIGRAWHGIDDRWPIVDAINWSIYLWHLVYGMVLMTSSCSFCCLFVHLPDVHVQSCRSSSFCTSWSWCRPGRSSTARMATWKWSSWWWRRPWRWWRPAWLTISAGTPGIFWSFAFWICHLSFMASARWSGDDQILSWSGADQAASSSIDSSWVNRMDIRSGFYILVIDLYLWYSRYLMLVSWIPFLLILPFCLSAVVLFQDRQMRYHLSASAGGSVGGVQCERTSWSSMPCHHRFKLTVESPLPFVLHSVFVRCILGMNIWLDFSGIFISSSFHRHHLLSFAHGVNDDDRWCRRCSDVQARLEYIAFLKYI